MALACAGGMRCHRASLCLPSLGRSEKGGLPSLEGPNSTQKVGENEEGVGRALTLHMLNAGGRSPGTKKQVEQ